MLTQCRQSQPTFGHFVNGHYAMCFPPPPNPKHTQCPSDRVKRRPASLPVHVDIWVNETEELYQQEFSKQTICFLELASQEQKGHSCASNEVWAEHIYRARECVCVKHVVRCLTQPHSRQREDVMGIQIPSREEKSDKQIQKSKMM